MICVNLRTRVSLEVALHLEAHLLQTLTPAELVAVQLYIV